MDKFEVDKEAIYALFELYKSGRINFNPDYQRKRVWNDSERYLLIDSIMQEFPIGLAMLDVVPHVDEDGVKVDKYDVVDGQQRLRTIFEYLDGEPWSGSGKPEDFKPFSILSASRQSRFREYRIPVAKMKEFDDADIRQCYSRLQLGKPLKIGEKLKALSAHPAYPFIKDVADHAIFDLENKRHKTRDAHWTLAAAFFKSSYTGDLFGRQEFANLADFMKSEKINRPKAKKSFDE